MRKIEGPCSEPECEKPHHCRGFCESHYRKFFINKKRYLKVKSDPILREKTRVAVNQYRHSEEYRTKRKIHDLKYYGENKEKILSYKKRWSEMKRFGRARVSILYQSGFGCALCGEEKDLVVHHKNGLGRCTNSPDNNPKNFVVLCRSCHMKIHHPLRGLLHLGKIDQ